MFRTIQTCNLLLARPTIPLGKLNALQYRRDKFRIMHDFIGQFLLIVTSRASMVKSFTLFSLARFPQKRTMTCLRYAITLV